MATPSVNTIEPNRANRSRLVKRGLLEHWGVIIFQVFVRAILRRLSPKAESHKFREEFHLFLKGR
jgi:hypothetical protein